MGGPGVLARDGSQRRVRLQSLQMMYFLEGGLLMVGNLLQTDDWVNDGLRTHCSVCVQQFLPFRRRHHCRTCGEVVCAGCSSQRAIRLTDMNVECETRVCTFCIIRATDTSIKANEAALRETSVEPQRLSAVSVLSLASAPAVRPDKRLTLMSAESELTTGSVVQLWPQPLPINETARLRVARHSTIRAPEADPTMNLLVNIVSRTLECPAAFIGIMDDSSIENNPEQVSEKDLMFGWFIVPCNRGDDESFATVSCITAQSFRSQPIDQNLSLDLLRRLNQKLAMARFFHLPSDAPCIKPSALRIKLPPAAAGNQNTLEGVNSVSSSDDSGLDLHSSERDSTVANTSGSVDYASRNTCTFQPEDNRAALVAIHQSGQTSELNQNEQMLLDLLDKTISTQEILAQRQNEMAGVLDTHGDQLQRLSVALERVEALLALKKLARKAKQASTTA
ncbi:pectin lyase F [Phytophthora cinnamomi]|uniref:pectin lyase F n=1 Tax=Phytophthora cinnamomi TaxID=4785 RepID=UPI00355A4ECD|nr:pectin lyase F [Phytophthora cinnamomi]